jgi:hypothetical protein
MNIPNMGELKMSTQVNTVGKRYNELRAQGIASKEAAETINREFKTNVAEVTIRSYGTQYKKKFGEVGPRSEREEHNELPIPAKLKQAKGQPVKAPPGQIPPTDIDDRIRTVAREVFQEMLHNMRNEMNIITDTEDTPPEPRVITGEGKGRRENRKYVKASVTVDEALWQRFTAERDRMRVSTGRLMDIILWRHFGKPKLSFEQ